MTQVSPVSIGPYSPDDGVGDEGVVGDETSFAMDISVGPGPSTARFGGGYRPGPPGYLLESGSPVCLFGSGQSVGDDDEDDDDDDEDGIDGGVGIAELIELEKNGGGLIPDRLEFC